MGLRATRYVLKWEFQEPPNVRGAGGLYAPRINEGARAEFHPAPLRCAHVRGISREVSPSFYANSVQSCARSVTRVLQVGGRCTQATAKVYFFFAWWHNSPKSPIGWLPVSPHDLLGHITP